MGRKKKKNNNQIFNKIINIVILLLISAIGIVFINKINLKKTDLTTSNISFYKKNKTDMITLSNIEMMPDTKGKSEYNNSTVSFNITSENNLGYDIIVDSDNNQIPYDKIKIVLLRNGKVEVYKLLSEFKNVNTGVHIFSTDKNNNDKITIRMWIVNDYDKKIVNPTFEVKIKQR